MSKNHSLNNIPEDLNLCLKWLRNKNQLTQKQLANLVSNTTNIKLSPITYSQYERNIRIPSYIMLENILKTLNSDFNKLTQISINKPWDIDYQQENIISKNFDNITNNLSNDLSNNLSNNLITHLNEQALDSSLDHINTLNNSLDNILDIPNNQEYNNPNYNNQQNSSFYSLETLGSQKKSLSNFSSFNNPQEVHNYKTKINDIHSDNKETIKDFNNNQPDSNQKLIEIINCFNDIIQNLDSKQYQEFINHLSKFK